MFYCFCCHYCILCRILQLYAKLVATRGELLFPSSLSPSAALALFFSIQILSRSRHLNIHNPACAREREIFSPTPLPHAGATIIIQGAGYTHTYARAVYLPFDCHAYIHIISLYISQLHRTTHREKSYREEGGRTKINATDIGVRSEKKNEAAAEEETFITREIDIIGTKKSHRVRVAACNCNIPRRPRGAKKRIDGGSMAEWMYYAKCGLARLRVIYNTRH